METKRPVAPRFLVRLDRYLLLNKPEIWSTRTHLVLYYSFLFVALLAGLAFLAPDDPRKDSSWESWMGIVSLLSFIAFVVWVIYLLRFNVFKRYGAGRPIERLIIFALYFVSIGCFVFFPFVKPLVEMVRANTVYSNREMVKDVNGLNMDITRLFYDSLDHRWYPNRVVVVDTVTAMSNYDQETDTVAGAVSHFEKTYIARDLIKERLETEDSVVQMNDSTYIFYTCPDYVFVESYALQRFHIPGVYESPDIYNNAVKNFRREDAANVKARIQRTVDKYALQKEYWNYYHHSATQTVEDRIRQTFHLNEVQSGMSNIMDRKLDFVNDLGVFLRIHIYITLILTLLVFAFRHSTAKAFFLSLLTSVILIVLTALMMAFGGGISTFLGMMVFYFLVFASVSVFVFFSSERSTLTGIAMNLFLWLLPFIPLCFVSIYWEEQARSYDYRSYDYETQVLSFQMAEWIGLGILIILLATYIPRLYRRWFAAPEE
jgi:hypothetical protein